MAKPPRRKRANLDYECDAFGCRPKTKVLGKSGIPIIGGGKRNPPDPRPGPRYDYELEKYPILKNLPVQPETDVNLDVSEVSPRGEKQLYAGGYQNAQIPGALGEAVKIPQFSTPQNLAQFAEASRKSLLKGGADERTISPTSKPEEGITIGKIPITKVHEQKLRQMLGNNYDIAKEERVASKTRYRTDPRTGERTAVEKTLFSPESVVKINLTTGRSTITDLTTGKVKYQNSPDIQVVKKEKMTPKTNTSITQVEGEANAPEADVKKEQLKAAAEVAKKPGYFSKEAIRSRQRIRRRKRYAQGSR